MIRPGSFRAIVLGLSVFGCGTSRAPASGAGTGPAGSTSAPAADPLAGGDFVIGPTYANAPELTVTPGTPTGTLTTFGMGSEDSKIYPGLRGPYMRNVTVYV